MYYVIKLEKPNGNKVVDLITTKKAEANKRVRELRNHLTLGYVINSDVVSVYNSMNVAIVVSNKETIRIGKDVRVGA